MSYLEESHRVRVYEQRSQRRKKWFRKGSYYVATYTLVVIGSIIFMVPFLWMLRTSLMARQQVFVWPIVWIPKPFVWQNYVDAFTLAPFARFFRNTILITIAGILGNLIGSSLAAYGFARMRFPGRDALFMVMLSTMMIPYTVTLIPTFIVFVHLGWIDTYKPLIVPQFFAVPFYTFLLRQFFLSIPFELEDAAKIDGCGIFGLFWRIALPLSKQALAAVAIFSFMAHWNAFLGPLIYLNDQAKYTLALALRMFQGQRYTNFPYLMAVSAAALAPCLLIFFLAQRLFIQGIVITGVKG